jgi:hypothetical protein
MPIRVVRTRRRRESDASPFDTVRRAPNQAGKPPADRRQRSVFEWEPSTWSFPPSQLLPNPDLEFPPDLQLESGLFARFGQKDRQLRGAIAREASYSLKVLRIGPGGQDDIPGSEFTTDLGATIASDEQYASAFRRAAPLTIGATAPAPEKSPFFLTVREVIETDKSQTIDLRLRSSSDTGQVFSGTSVIVIDPEPFLVAQIRVGQVDAGLAVTTEIGNWSTRAGEGAGWELNAAASGFDLALPPQGLGEEMHRHRGAGDVLPGTPADFRFTPPTIATLQASFFRQRFAEAPWNLRRILGFPGQRSPGAGVDRLRLEFLYGMPARSPTHSFVSPKQVRAWA